MKYKVIHPFHDLEDFVQTKTGNIYQAYKVGDFYPRDGFETTAGRIAELGTNANAIGTPLIEVPMAEPVEAIELEGLKKGELVELAEASGIEVPKRATKAEIINLIEENGDE